MEIIDMDRLRVDGNKLFIGREYGAKLREAARLHVHDRERKPVRVIFGRATFWITSSFLSAMFGDSVRKLGGEAFREVYRFESGTPLRLSQAVDDLVKEVESRVARG